ncbi:protein HtrL-like [Saccostrea echinata]|uniref:protein HtrL-like n=1 Tax=Saccostrea echinata TaxID=191078 RepID=UPI002A7FAD26|nr:protein HtrL-like [Saccostrea echinata]
MPKYIYAKISLVFFLCLLNVQNGQAHQPNQEAVFVTALYDIGRENWTHFQRSFDEYLSYFRNVLRLNVKMIIYSNESVQKVVLDERKILDHKTQTYMLKFTDLEFYRYRQHIGHVLVSPEFRNSNEMLNHPEAFSVKYLILMNNKVSFLSDAVRKNPFNSTHFFWIDAGYGHGDDLTKWKNFQPRILLSKRNKITYIELNDPALYKDINDLHKVQMAPAFCGGFFGGDAGAILKYEKLYKKTFRKLLTENIVDDDQNVAFQCYVENPSLFENIRGHWFDAFKLFS